MAIGDVVRAVLQGVGPTAEQLINGLTYRQSTGTGDLDMGNQDTWFTEFLGALISPYLDCLGLDYTFVQATVAGLNGAVANLFFTDDSLSGSPGSGSDNSGNFERCALLRKRTGVGGRHGHGRIFLPLTPAANFFTDGAVDPAGPDLAAFTAFGTAMATPFTHTDSGTWVPVLVDRNTISTLDIISVDLAPVCGVQRRRRFGVGA